jgi:hypothetical protein
VIGGQHWLIGLVLECLLSGMDERGRCVYVRTEQAMAFWQKRARMMDGISSNSIEGGIGSDLSLVCM